MDNFGHIIGGPDAPHTYEDGGGVVRRDGHGYDNSLVKGDPLDGFGRFGYDLGCAITKLIPNNVLYKSRCYLIGHMQYLDGRGWRDTVKSELSNRNITFFDPYHKPFVHDIPEDEAARLDMNRWMETEQYDLVQQRMWEVRGYDLRLCDICDFFIAHINPSVASWGSAEEITTVIREKKPLFLSIEGGKKKTPLWLMGKVPHKYIYNNIQEVVDTVKHIDDGVIKMSSDRWKLLKPELR